MPVRVFTLEEANRLIPEIRDQLLWFQDAVREIVDIQDSISVLEMIGAAKAESPEHDELLRKRTRLDEQVHAYNERLEEFQNLGCLVKSIEHGLVDFYCVKEGRLVFLCWQLDEPRVYHWHEINGGFAGRRPVTEL